jgi:hypothetical protein
VKRTFFLLLSIIPFGAALAQDDTASTKIFLGPLATYTFGSPVSINRQAGHSELFSTGGKGVSWDNAVSLGARIMLPSLFARGLGFSATANYTVGSGTFKSNEFSLQGYPADFRIVSNYQTAGLQGLATFSLGEKWYVGSGLYMTARTKSDLSQHLELLSSDPSVHFANGSKDSTIASGEQLGTSRFHYGIPLAIGGRFPLSRTMYLTTEIFSQVDLGEVVRGYAGNAFSAGLSLGLLFDLEPPPVLAASEAKNGISASVFFIVNGVSARTTASHRIDSPRRRYVVLPAVVGFSGDIPAERFRMLGREEVSGFDPSSLDRETVDKCYGELLNIIGKRLRDHPEEQILLASAKPARAEILRQYFLSVWDVAALRVRTVLSATEDVTITGSMKILSPLINEWHDEYRETPEITVQKIITSPSGVKEWSLTIADGEKIIAEYSSGTREQAGSNATIGERSIDTAEHIFRAHLIATDSLGNKGEASDSIRIVPSYSSDAATSMLSETYVLLADSLLSTSSWSSLLLDRLASNATPSQTISIRALDSSGRNGAAEVSKRLLASLQKNGKGAKRIVIENESSLSPSLRPPLDSAIEIRVTNDHF